MSTTAPNPPTTLPDWLDDLTVRFLLNLPPTELSSVPRLCFQVEEAQWFYEDFIRPAFATTTTPLPSLPLRQFCLQLFQHCPLLSGFTDAQHLAAYEEFLAYKVRVPVRGAILIDERMERVVLVKGWKKGASWSFPRGKINKDERDLDCAVREVFEETGFDARAAGLVPDAADGIEKEGEMDGVKYIDVTMREQHIRLFVFRGVPVDTHFEPQTRKEISKIAWYDVRDLPGFRKQKTAAAEQANKFYMVAPFLGPLRRWVAGERKKDAGRTTSGAEAVRRDVDAEAEAQVSAAEDLPVEDAPVVDKSEELRRLMGIEFATPAPPPAPAFPPQHQPTFPLSQPSANSNGGSNGNSKHLLSLLQGTSAVTPPPATKHDSLSSSTYYPTSPPSNASRHASMPFNYPNAPMDSSSLTPRSLHAQHAAQGGFSGMPAQHAGAFGFGQGIAQQQHQQRYASQSAAPPGWQHMPSPFPQQHGSMAAAPPNMHSYPLQQPAHFPSAHQASYPPHLQAAQPTQGPQNPQGPQEAIQAGPSAPKAMELPLPKLSRQKMDLLTALKSGGAAGSGKQITDLAGTTVPGAGAELGSEQQKKLLDLFRVAAPSRTAAPSWPRQQDSEGLPKSIEPRGAGIMETGGDVDSEEVRGNKQRQATLAEITRTLPRKGGRVGSQAIAAQIPQAIAMQKPVTAAPPPSLARRAAEDTERANVRANGSRDQEASVPVALERSVRRPKSATARVAVAFRPPSSSRSPEGKLAGGSVRGPPARENGSPKAAVEQLSRRKQPLQQQQPAFTILRRPASSASSSAAGKDTEVAKPGSGTLERSALGHSVPLRQERPERRESQDSRARPGSATRHLTAAPQPQLLKRPGSGDAPRILRKAEDESAGEVTEGEKRERLLRLFGKGGTGRGRTSPDAGVAAEELENGHDSPKESNKGSELLKLFAKSSEADPKPSRPAAATPSLPPHVPASDSATFDPRNPRNPTAQPAYLPPTMTPPPAPQLVPERKPSTQSIPTARQPSQQQQQKTLLDLFTRPSSSTANRAQQLQSPGGSVGTPVSPFALGTPVTANFGERGREGKAGMDSERLESRRGSGREGAAEAGKGKGFWLEYLDGVVRGAGK
ncbi:hypothetical protein B0A50_03632 [Salinomyces thailandicus]|uniref:Nudix hydrolase domain-containing protein n=1 Tax=Salinomyces thailandicus TaxID=706561 RepID=A0A4U0U3M6_9PEZI|nr:hypothetical protein B0A50_03632 [Salinomyces thailandica]